MKVNFTLLFLFFLQYSAISQCPSPEALSIQDGNLVSGMITNGGDLFWDGDDAQFNAPTDLPIDVSTIFAASLWMGGFDEASNLKLAGQTYGRNSSSFDYSPGPLNENGGVNEDYCQDFNRIWKATQADIDAHKADFADNGTIDNPLPSIYGWPGRNNLNFQDINGFELPDVSYGWAPFFDLNANGNYEPENGDYPHPPNTLADFTPASINWTVFNDATLHTESQGDQIQAEVHLTSWSFSCSDNEVLNRTMFTSHKIINKAIETITDFHAGMWIDFDLGCYTDDYIGSYPEKDAFFVYNSDALDGQSSANDCQGVNTYANNPPAQSVQLLNQSMDYFTYYNNGGINPPPPPGTTDPSTAIEIYNYLTGKWADGTPMTLGGDGYDPTSTQYTNHAFSGNPNNTGEWSMFEEGLADGDRRAVASSSVGTLNPGQIFTMDLAYTFHQNTALDHLEIVNEMYTEIDMIQGIYDNQFSSMCTMTSSVNELLDKSIALFPNPSNGTFSIETDNIQINAIQLFDMSGRLLWSNEETISHSKSFDLSHLSNGIYILQIETAEGVIPKKLVIGR